MLYECYLRKKIVYLPTLGKIEAGFYRSMEPVAVVPVQDNTALHRALRETISRGNPKVVALRRAMRPEPVLLKHAGVKTWSSFARTALTWNISDEGGAWRIVGQRRHPEGGWEDDPEQTVTFPPGSGVDEVCERMIAILQENARSPGR